MGGSGVGTLLRAALPTMPGIGALPGVRKAPLEGFTGMRRSREGVVVERAHVDAYAGVCGFPRKDTVPLPYPHLLGFDLQLAILADRAFPAPAIGTVHIDNSVRAHREMRVGERLDVEVSVGSPLPHRKGVAFAFATTVRDADGEVAWEEVSTYLSRGRSVPGVPAPDAAYPEVGVGSLTWPLPGDLGRRYAAVSGDRNPIHLHPLSARALGFPRHIAHGMWTLARCVASLENRIPGAARVDVSFRRPVLLPGTVALGTRRTDDGWAFALTSPDGTSTHLVGAAHGCARASSGEKDNTDA
ncbi:hypothetical protein GHK92_03600 [Nocardioides sp. dk4132]|uniref:MaoC/PaaZ C-terminal domain-containing protein n=1 Tax=unclassified Nocardioides TaxID=2615069 RepID=UPI001294F2C8|nr:MULTISPECIES: MaoC/PaaZ C-terminal domain-containing protein [unclassified Nocardioides]MQW74948.1 hypothetical protein [Nocardioides sp. dk4132]QGA07867.1 hypothetical protein GFH29_11010 [Nocardioides sp. dk884]